MKKSKKNGKKSIVTLYHAEINSNKYSYALIYSFFSFFLVPPQKPQIFDGTGRDIGGIAGPYTEGSTMSLTCVASGGMFNIYF